jgi:hypothetical protein
VQFLPAGVKGHAAEAMMKLLVGQMGMEGASLYLGDDLSQEQL